MITLPPLLRVRACSDTRGHISGHTEQTGINMIDQGVFNVAITIAGALGGWVLNTVWNAVKDLQRDDKILSDKVASIEVLVAGKYVTRDEFSNQISSVMVKLDLISEKLDRKVDK